jgi:hypothetical protein
MPLDPLTKKVGMQFSNNRTIIKRVPYDGYLIGRFPRTRF